MKILNQMQRYWYVLVESLLALIVGLGLYFWFCSPLLPSDRFAASLPPTSYYNPVSFEAISQEVRSVTVIAGEPNFYTQSASLKFFQLSRLIVYRWRCIPAGTCREIGFTIPQRTVLQWLTLTRGPSQHTFWSEMRELTLNIRLIQRYTPDEILTLHLNQTFYGDGVYGIEAAARHYFGKPAADLNVGEAAILEYFACFPAARDVTQIRAGQTVILDRMVELGYITQEQARQAQDETSLPVIGK